MKINYTLIEKYLLGEMQDTEKLDFEKRMQTEKDLFAEYELRKKVNDSILESDVINLRHTMNSIMNDKHAALEFRRSRFFYWQLAAAVVVVFIIVKTVFFNDPKTPDYNILFAEYYQLYPSFSEFRNGDTQSVKSILFAEAVSNYESKEFSMAEKSLEQILRADSSEIMAKFYLAITQIEQNKLDEAYAILSSLAQDRSHLFYEQSVWYLALVGLKENKPEETKKMLELIIRENYYCSEQARKLLRKLN